MKNCSKSIIECLRDNNIYPSATSNGALNSYYNAQVAIDYKPTNYYYYGSHKGDQWWMVDFKKDVEISVYQITAGAICDWIENWRASVSMNGVNWKVVDTREEGFQNEKIFPVKPARARYFRIDAKKGTCGYTMAFNSIKFYGYLYSRCNHLCTQRQKKVIDFDILIFIVLVYY